MRRCVACGTDLAADGWRCPACGFEPELRDDGIRYFAPAAIDAGRGFDPAAFERLSRTEERSFWFRGRNAMILWALDRYFAAAGSFLEVGCGTGFVLRGIREAHPRMALAGAELYPEGLRFAAERVPDAELLQLDAIEMPYDGEWDAVGAFDVLEHIEDDEAAIRGMRQAARPGGGVLITVPQHPSLWSGADDYAHHQRRYTRRELVSKVERAGLRVERVTSFVTLLLPAMYLSRRRERRAGAGYDPAREHASAERVPLLERALDAERWAIARGVSLPAGGSLLLVARRP
jgi:SAM-dependent methyltransferase